MIGNTISHYKILEKLGEGGMGVVYKARDERLDRFVALKFLSPSLTRDEGFKERFVQEAKAASSLDHPNICTVYDIDEADEGQLFICMSYYDGETLAEKLARGAVPLEEAVDIVTQTARGLARAHKAGIVHWDIKPANLMVTAEGVAKILDFGLAKRSGAMEMTKRDTTVGTAGYMSPEQIRGEVVDYRTDIWSLGVVLQELLTGKRPFLGEYEAALVYSIVNEEPQPLETSEYRVPKTCSAVVRKALEKDPERRYADVDEFLRELSGDSPEAGAEPGPEDRGRRRRRLTVGLAVAIAAAAIGYVSMARHAEHQERIEWAMREGLPEIERLVPGILESGGIEAYELAIEVEKIIPGDPTLRALLEQCSRVVTVRTTPPGASISYRPYETAEDAWTHLGESPLVDARVPYELLMWKMEKPGHETVQVLSFSRAWDLERGVEIPLMLERRLDREGSWPEDMVLIPGEGELGDFYIDRYEVTNKSFKAFVGGGGYRQEDYWKHEFIRGGQVFPWEEAMAVFRDATGRPGPATWEAGSYPEGKGDDPVSGVSWYEAAAYAEFAGKSLPTVRHWGLARGNIPASWRYTFVSLSNFSGEGPAPVGSHSGLSVHGAHDMAGNVREWCWNESSEGRCVRGGAWNDATYMDSYISQALPFDRNPKNGFRCVLYPDPDRIPDAAFRPVLPTARENYAEETPVTDDVFEVYRTLFAYDRTPLDPVVERIDTLAAGVRYEQISLQAAYGGERFRVHLFLPPDTEPPYQTIVYFPGAGSLWARERPSKDLATYWEFQQKLAYIVKSGRAVLYPVYKGTFERALESGANFGRESLRYREWSTQLVKDLRRSIDYLETRSDIDTTSFAYYGFSWGGGVGPIVSAVESRIRASILEVGGLWQSGRPRPEVNAFNYAPRVRVPTLMLNGRYDSFFPFEVTVKPMYDLLGTPAEHKLLRLYDSDHIVPRTEVIRETLNWLDRYLGPVR